MRTVLLTGFEPFDQDTLNPSWEAVRLLDETLINEDVRIIARQLPCVFSQAPAHLHALIERFTPHMVLAVGLGPGRSDIALERVAINLIDARIPDNLGEQPVDIPVAAEGPTAYFSTLPIKAMVAALRAAGIPATVSHTAGTFVCNQVFYSLQHSLAGSTVRSGFMHVPLLTEQVALAASAQSSMSLDILVKALRVAVSAALNTLHDVRETGGQLC